MTTDVEPFSTLPADSTAGDGGGGGGAPNNGGGGGGKRTSVAQPTLTIAPSTTTTTLVGTLVPTSPPITAHASSARGLTNGNGHGGSSGGITTLKRGSAGSPVLTNKIARIGSQVNIVQASPAGTQTHTLLGTSHARVGADAGALVSQTGGGGGGGGAPTHKPNSHSRDKHNPNHNYHSPGDSSSGQHVEDPTKPTASLWSKRQLIIYAKPHHLWALGIVIVLGGQYFSWNLGLNAGVGSFTICTILIGSAYLNMCMSLAEMASAIPFAGGSYGYARATIGKFAGYFVGVAETLEYTFYVAVTVYLFGESITSIAGTDRNWEPLWWFLFYVFSNWIHIAGGQFFWTFNFVFAVFIIVIQVFYWVGTSPFANFQLNAPWPDATTETEKWFVGGFDKFLYALPLATWWYIGIEAVPIAAEEAFEPKKNIPTGIVSGMLTLLIGSVCTLFATASSPPGIQVIANSLLPFNYGFQQLFGGKLEYMGLISMPAVYGTAFGFMFAYGRQVFAMARSGLFPDCFSWTYRDRGTPYIALIGCSLIGFVTCAIGFIFVDPKHYVAVVFDMCLFGALCTYLFQMVTYIILKHRFPQLHRDYQSPTGIPGAIWSIIVFTFALYGAISNSASGAWPPIVGIACWFAFFVTYYYAYARYNLKLSPEEQFCLFMVYSIKFVRGKQNDLTKKRNKDGKAESLVDAGHDTLVTGAGGHATISPDGGHGDRRHAHGTHGAHGAASHHHTKQHHTVLTKGENDAPTTNAAGGAAGVMSQHHGSGNGGTRRNEPQTQTQAAHSQARRGGGAGMISVTGVTALSRPPRSPAAGDRGLAGGQSVHSHPFAPAGALLTAPGGNGVLDPDGEMVLSPMSAQPNGTRMSVISPRDGGSTINSQTLASARASVHRNGNGNGNGNSVIARPRGESHAAAATSAGGDEKQQVSAGYSPLPSPAASGPPALVRTFTNRWTDSAANGGGASAVTPANGEKPPASPAAATPVSPVAAGGALTVTVS